MRKVCLCLCACAAIPVCAALRTAEIQGRIDAAAAAGGGEVVIEAGEYEVGGLYLKSNVTLHLARGARLISYRNRLLFACARTEHPKLFGFVRPCDSVYLITLRTYLVKHTHSKPP